MTALALCERFVVRDEWVKWRSRWCFLIGGWSCDRIFEVLIVRSLLCGILEMMVGAIAF